MPLQCVEDLLIRSRFSTPQILELNFGNWEIFRQLITGLREIERQQQTAAIKFGFEQGNAFDSNADNFIVPENLPRKKSVMEKQVIKRQQVMGTLSDY